MTAKPNKKKKVLPGVSSTGTQEETEKMKKILASILLALTLTMVNSAYAQVAPVIHAPANGAKLYDGDVVSIRWESTRPDAWKTVHISLRDEKSETMDWIAFSAPNTGEFSWKVKKWATTSTEFTIGVSDGGNVVNSSFVSVSVLDRSLRPKPMVTIRKDTKVPDQNIVKNAPYQLLGGYEVEVKNGPVIVRPAPFYISTTKGGVGNLINMVLIDSVNTVLCGPVDPEYLYEGNPLGEVSLANFDDTFVLDDGVHFLFIQGKALAGFPFNGQLATGTSLRLWKMTDMDGNVLTGDMTDTVVGQIMTVMGPRLTVSFTGPADAKIVGGSRQASVGTYTLDATESGEDVRVITLGQDYKALGDGSPLDNTNIGLYVRSTAVTTGYNLVNPQKNGSIQFTLDGTGLVVPKGTVVTLDERINVSTSANGSYSFGLPETTPQDQRNLIQAFGMESAQNADVVIEDSETSVITAIATGKFRVQLAQESPAPILTAPGREMVLAIFNFPAEDESFSLRSFGLRFTGSNANALKYRKYTLWTDSVQIGEGFFFPGEKTSQAFFAELPTLPNGRPAQKITVKAETLSAGTDVITNGDTVGVAYNHERPQDTIAVGADSGANVSPTSDSVAEGNLITIEVSTPTEKPSLRIVVDPSTPTEVTTGEAIAVAKFRVRGHNGLGNPLVGLGWEFTLIADGVQGAQPFLRASVFNSEGREVVSSDDTFTTLTEWPKGQTKYPAGSGSVLLAGDFQAPDYVGYPLGDDVYTLVLRVPWELAGKTLTIASESLSAKGTEGIITSDENPKVTVQVAQVATEVTPDPVVPPTPVPLQAEIVLDVSFAPTTSTEVEVGQNINAKVHVSGRSTQDSRTPQLLAWGFSIIADGLSIDDIVPFTLSSEDGHMVASSDQPPSEAWAWGQYQPNYPEGTPHVILVTGDIFNTEFVGHSLANATFNVAFTIPASLAGKYITVVSDEIVATLDNHYSVPWVEQNNEASITLYVRPPTSSGGGNGSEVTVVTPTPVPVENSGPSEEVGTTLTTTTGGENGTTVTTPVPVESNGGGGATTTTPVPVDNGVTGEVVPDVETVPVEIIEEPIVVVNDLTKEVVETVIVSYQPQDNRWFILVRARRPLQAGEYVEWATAGDGLVTRTEFRQDKPGLAYAVGDNFSYIGFFVPKDSYPEGADWSWLKRFGLVSILR